MADRHGGPGGRFFVHRPPTSAGCRGSDGAGSSPALRTIVLVGRPPKGRAGLSSGEERHPTEQVSAFLERHANLRRRKGKEKTGGPLEKGTAGSGWRSSEYTLPAHKSQRRWASVGRLYAPGPPFLEVLRGKSVSRFPPRTGRKICGLGGGCMRNRMFGMTKIAPGYCLPGISSAHVRRSEKDSSRLLRACRSSCFGLKAFGCRQHGRRCGAEGSARVFSGVGSCGLPWGLPTPANGRAVALLGPKRQARWDLAAQRQHAGEVVKGGWAQQDGPP